MLGLTPKPRGLTSGQEILWLLKLAALFFFLAPHIFGQSGAVFQGQVLDRSDSPITGAAVTLKSSSRTVETKSDKNGHFEFVVPPETYELEVSARGFETRTIKTFRISPSNRAVTVFLDLGPMSSLDPVVSAKNYKPGEHLDGTVMDEFGAAITNASVILKSAKKTLRSKSGPNGGFAFKHVPVGKYSLTTSGEGFQSKTIEDVKITREDSPGLQIVLDAADSP
jgi:Carboxypeptidase regulatory-like domain